MARQAVVDETVRQEVLDGRAPSVAHLYRSRVATSGPREALQSFAPDPSGTERLEHLTWDETRERTDLWAAGLVSLGLRRGAGRDPRRRASSGSSPTSRCCRGRGTTTIYPTTMAADVAYIVADSGSVVFAEDDGQVEKLREHRRDARRLRVVTSTARRTRATG